MYILITQNAHEAYTGRAGPGWVGPIAEAFIFQSRSEAERRRMVFNTYSKLHGLEWRVLACALDEQGVTP